MKGRASARITSGKYVEVHDYSVPLREGCHEAIDKAMRKAVIDIVAGTQDRMTENDTIDTGALRASVYASTPGQSGYEQVDAYALALKPGKKSKRPNHNFVMLPEVECGENEAIAAVGAEYGIYVEMGTVYTAPNPAFIPASQELIDSFEEVVKTLVEEETK